jgi:hypothetical protein
MTELGPAWDRRLRESKLYKDPLAFMPLVGVVAVPLAFLIAGSYELGRARRFGIPEDMVRVDLRVLVGLFFPVLAWLYILLPLGYQVQRLGLPRTASVIFKRIRGVVFLLFVIVGVVAVWQGGAAPVEILSLLIFIGFIYVVLYAIPSLLGRLGRLLARMRRPKLHASRRRVRRALSAVWRHVMGERWTRPSFNLLLAQAIVVLLLSIVIVPYAVGSFVALANQRYPVLRPVTSQGEADAILAVYGDKVFIADVQEGAARAVIVKNLADVNGVEIKNEDVGWLAWDLCQREPDSLSRGLCVIFGEY